MQIQRAHYSGVLHLTIIAGNSDTLHVFDITGNHLSEAHGYW